MIIENYLPPSLIWPCLRGKPAPTKGWVVSEMKIVPLEFEKPLFELRKKLEDLTNQSGDHSVDLRAEIESMQQKIEETKTAIYRNLSAWQRVQIARHTARPYALDYVWHCFTDYVELAGDRCFGEDKSMPAGFATIDGHRCMVIGHQKGRNTKENLLRNFGCAHPEGYRKALRLMKLAEKFQLPVIAMIDTPGAYPGVGAEERHIAEAIAVNLREMMVLRTPIISVVIGEGGSGGALGIGVADRVLMLENAYYSVISPEGCAAILWKHRSHAADAAEALKLTADDLLKYELIDDVVPEPLGGAHQNHEATYASFREKIVANLASIKKVRTDRLLEDRYAKFRKFGVFDTTG